MTFKPGQSGNPAGRPSGLKAKYKLLEKTVLPYKEKIMEQIITMALNGDKDMLRFAADRLIPRPQDNAVIFNMAKEVTAETLFDTGNEVIKQVAEGDILPDDGQTITNMLKSQRDALVLQNMSAEIKELRELVNKLGNK